MTETSLPTKKISLNNVNLHYYTHGSGSEKVLLLHGFGSSIKSWQKFIQLFPEQQYTVLFPELPGFGGSSNPPQPWHVRDYTDFIINFCQQLNFSPKYLICHSFGGRISIDLLSRQNSLNIEKAAFIAAAGIRPKLTIFKKIIPIIGKCLGFIKKIPLIGKIYSNLVQKFRKLIGAADYNLVSGTMKQTFTNVINTDLSHKIPKIQIPVHLFWGTHDTYTPLYMGQKIDQLLPNSQLHIYNGKKHGLHLTMPDQLYQDITQFFHV